MTALDFLLDEIQNHPRDKSPRGCEGLSRLVELGGPPLIAGLCGEERASDDRSSFLSTLPTATSSSCCHSGLYPHTVSRDDPFPELVIVRDFVAAQRKQLLLTIIKYPR